MMKETVIKSLRIARDAIDKVQANGLDDAKAVENLGVALEFASATLWGYRHYIEAITTPGG